MFRKTSIILLFLVAVVAKTSSEEISLEVFFSPRGGCTAAIVNEISSAKESIKVQAYGFSSQPIAQALIASKSRGVVVVVILDRSNNSARYSQAQAVSQAGIETRIDSEHTIAHNKVIIIDSLIVITGSFNFSDNAENKNAENLVIIRNKSATKKYTENWSKHFEHSTPYKK